MYETIKKFPEQFRYVPKLENGASLPAWEKYVAVGMGGSHLPADLLLSWKPSLDVVVHSDYGLPTLPDIEKRIIIALSYSGNTEEALDAFEEALRRKLPVAAVATGGKLLERAKREKIPYVELPKTGIQPRMALGLSLHALLRILGDKEGLQESASLAELLRPGDLEGQGRELAERLYGCVPIVYASTRNRSIAYNWKIKFNETGKIPAFWNVVPELNHNEMTGFDVVPKTKSLSDRFFFILLEDAEDDSEIQTRMKVLKNLYRDRGLRTETVSIRGESRLHAMFSSLLLADWVAYSTAEKYGVEPEQVPMVEEFKKLIA